MQRWHLQDSAGSGYTADEAKLLLQNRLDWGTRETWFEDPQGRTLAVITNGDRAMVMLFDHDAEQHLTDPGAQGDSSGFVLANGQVDTYADRDTVPFTTAARAVAYFMEHGAWPGDVIVADD